MNQPPFSTEIRMVPPSARATDETLTPAIATNAAMIVRTANDRISIPPGFGSAHKVTGIREKKSLISWRIMRAFDVSRVKFAAPDLPLWTEGRIDFRPIRLILKSFGFHTGAAL